MNTSSRAPISEQNTAELALRAEYGRTFREVPVPLDASGSLVHGRSARSLLRAGTVTGPELITVDR